MPQAECIDQVALAGEIFFQFGAGFRKWPARVVLRVALPVGRGVIEVGAESGGLDTPAVRGTLGGVYGSLGWSVGL